MVAFTRHWVSSYLTFPPWLAGEGPPADYFCCTFPGVAPGGCYPLSLPCGARTFLTDGLSAWPRGCPACLRKSLYFIFGWLSNGF